MRAFVYIILVATVFIQASANRNKSIERKASQFYDQQEWASASAMYDLIIEGSHPSPADFGHAIVSAEMQNDTTSSMALTEKAASRQIDLDSVFHYVRSLSFDQGMTSLYEGYLLQVKQHIPWMRRVADNYLMDYYTFRNNGPMMISYSELMLRGLPDDIRFLTTLARGYMIVNKPDKAVEVFSHILQLDPDNYEVILTLGNYYLELSRDNHDDSDSKTKAVQYLNRASAIRSTPYVNNLILSLTDDSKGKK